MPEPAIGERVAVEGKFLRLGDRPFRVRGTTYGTFQKRADGERFPEPAQVLRDFRAMAQAGLNTVRTYGVPPKDVLEIAAETGLWLIVGLHYHDWRLEPTAGRRANRRVLDGGRRAVAEALTRCAESPFALALSVGNEVPADIVRLHGIARVEETLSALVREVHEGGSKILATYTNYPTTEYLEVDGQDIATFNVFLEDPDDLRRYLRHLQLVAGDLPLLITELGLASELHGLEAQAHSLAWQLRLVEETGCAGATVFSWTDDWHVDDHPVDGWGFGLTSSHRGPKPALEVVRAWTRTTVRDLRSRWPTMSVVVCAHNEARLVDRCLSSLERCDYPGLEVIFCDDGSTDETLERARRCGFRVLALKRGGLSRARNAGLAAAGGEIVAFLDADAECHPEWPYHLALSLEEEGVAAAGGPNLPPEGAPFVERAIASSPGGPVNVLVGDDRAEHITGCNMAFRKDALDEIDGFDPIFRAAGDDVDVCWRLLDNGDEIAFAAAAQVRHHRPSSLREYVRQQHSYGRAEGMLQGRHRHRFNALGSVRWSGSIYGGPRVLPNLLRPIVYHGPMGLAPFQAVTERRGERALAQVSSLLPLSIPLALVGALAPLSRWLLLASAFAAVAMIGYGAMIAAAARPERGEERPLRFRLLVGLLHVVQPLVRTWSRLRAVKPGPASGQMPWTSNRAAWLEELARTLAARGCTVRRGGPHDSWDLSVSIGPLVSFKVTTAVAWGWSPVKRSVIRARAPAIAAAAAAIVLSPLAPVAGIAVIGAALVTAATEIVVLHRAVSRSLSATTQGAAGNLD
jgi:glycosyl transferase family 2